MTLRVLALRHTLDRPFRVQLNADLGQVQFKGALGESVRPELARDPTHVVKHRGDGPLPRRRLLHVRVEQALRVLVRETLRRTNHGVHNLERLDLQSAVEAHDDALGETVPPLAQARQVRAQAQREHRDHAGRQIDRGASTPGFTIRGRARRHVVGDVRNVDGDLEPSSDASQTDRVVEVLGILRVDRHEKLISEVHPIGAGAG